MKAPAVVRDASQDGKTRKARMRNSTLKAIPKTDVSEKSFSIKALRMRMTEKRLFREAKIPKKKPLTIYSAVFTI